jgi:hypothetical protein
MPHDIIEVGGSDTTSRRHSKSTVQPRRRVIDSNALEFREKDESALPIQVSSQSDDDGRLVSHDDLVEYLNFLSLGRDDPGPVSSSSVLPPVQPSSIPTFTPHDLFPESISPYPKLNLSTPGGSQTLMKSSESWLSTGRSPSLGPRNFQDPAMTSQPEHSPTSPFILAQDIGHIAQPGAGFSRLSIVPRSASDTDSKLPQPRQSISDLGKGVPLHDLPASSQLFIVEFKADRTDLFYATDLTLDIHFGDLVIVEAERGRDLGRVVNDTITLAEVEKFQQSSHVGYSETLISPGEHTSLSAGDTGTRSEREINPKQIYGKAGTGDTL